MRGPWIAFMRIRSPSSAPPVRRRVGSTSSSATLASGRSRRSRSTSSSTTLDLPAPPVPVKPITGAAGRVRRAASAARQPAAAGSSSPADSSCVIHCATALGVRGRERRELRQRARRRAAALVEQRADHALEPERAALGGAEDPRHAARLERARLFGRDRAAAPAVHADVRPAELAEPLDEVAEELHVAALVRRHRDGARVLLDRGRRDLLDRAVVAEVDHLGALRLEQPAHDVDRGVVAVEQRRGGHHAHAVRLAHGMQRNDRGRGAHAPPLASLRLAARNLPPARAVRARRAPDPAPDAVAVGVDLAAQRDQLGDPRLHLGAVAREQLVEPREHRARRAADPVDRVQLLDLREREPERLEPRDEAQPLELVRAVHAAPARAPAHAGQQAHLLVVAQRARRDARVRAHLRDREIAVPPPGFRLCQLTSTG